MASAVARPRLRWSQLRLSTKLCYLALLLLLSVAGLELISRVYWCAFQGARGTGHEALWRTFYPEVAESGIDRVAPLHGDDSFDVLLFGGSVVSTRLGKTGDYLQSALEAKLGRKVRVVNSAFPGRTTRDTRIKYEHFADKRWDLVLVYHGINDVFLNNCPPGTFRPDYGHAYRRFGMQYDLEKHPETAYFVLPYTVSHLGKSLMERWHMTNAPRAEFEIYGNDVRTPPCFEDNLEAVARAAEERGDPLVLNTFAYYLAPNYSDEAFRDKKLDYAFGPHYLCAAKMWGEPANLGRTIDLHNDVVRRVAGRHGLQVIDQRADMPDGKRYYNDPCHFTDEGCRRWVDNVLNGLDLSKIRRGDGR